MARVTVVNDHPEFLAVVEEVLEDDRYEVTTVDGDAPDAWERIVESSPDLLMIDLRMGTEKLHGWDIAQRVRQDARFLDLPVLICSADAMALREMSEQLAEDHRVRVLTKPFSIDQLTAVVQEMLGGPVAT